VGKVVVPSWRDKREDSAWEKIDTKDKNLPNKMPSYLKKYEWYDSYDKAVNAWANFNRPFSKEVERCALIYQYTDIKGNRYYTYGETKIGMDEIPKLGIRDNVVFALLDLLFRENVFHSRRIGFVHTHPDLPGNDQFSTEDNFVYLAPGIDFKSVAPYGKKGVKTE